MAIVTGVDFIFLFFFFPETQYRRDTTPINQSISSHDKASTSIEVQAIIPKKPYIQQLKPFSGINPGIDRNTSLISLFIRPWPLVVYPAVIYSFLVFSFNLGWLQAVNNTAAVIFQSPPYNFSPGVQSLIFLCSFVGAGIGAFWGGALTDVIVQAFTRGNNGIYEPESRLVAIILPLFVVPAGVLM